MKINKHCKIELCASSDSLREVMCHPYLDTSDANAPVVVATDGRRLVCVPVETEEGDVSGYVTAAALKSARKASKFTETATIHANGALVMDDGTSLPRPAMPKAFPDWKQCVPADMGEVRISFDAQLLLDIAKAIGSGSTGGPVSVTLRFKDERSPIYITGGTASGFGVLMPVRTW